MQSLPVDSQYLTEGGEAKIYLAPDQLHVIKNNDAVYYATWLEYFNSLVIHNLLFPNTAYKFVGFTLGKEGELRAVLQQRFIEGEQAELGNIKEYLNFNGFAHTNIMDRLSLIEQENQISLPEIYKDFYRLCSFAIPAKLIGTDLRNTHPELNQWAIEFLEEEGIENFLDDNDFVFMMHQGYMFWYFKADGNLDPIVHGYYENKIKPDNLGHLSEFIKEYLS